MIVSKDPTHREFPVVCVRHGHKSVQFLDDKQLAGAKGVLCKKCGLKAVPMNLFGALEAIPDLIKEIAKLRLDVMDLQCETEDGPDGKDCLGNPLEAQP